MPRPEARLMYVAVYPGVLLAQLSAAKLDTAHPWCAGGRTRFRRMTLKVCPAYFNPRRIRWLTPFRQEATCHPAPPAAPTVTTKSRWSRGVTSRPVLPAATLSGTLSVAATASTIPTLTGWRDEKASLDCSCLARTKSLDGLATQTGRGRSLHLISPAVAQKQLGVQ